MSVIIKGMKMPKSCDSCDLIQFDDEELEAHCPLSPYYRWCGTPPDYRPEGCPLVELPTPHGVDGCQRGQEAAVRGTAREGKGTEPCERDGAPSGRELCDGGGDSAPVETEQQGTAAAGTADGGASEPDGSD